MRLEQRRVTVGVAGGIAAYKAAELVRLLVKEGAEVQAVMTRAAERFITPMTLAALTGREVGTDLFDLDKESRIGHIQLADRAELLVVAPATADVIARFAAGLADDLLTTIALATKAPLLLAPAMNVNMWGHPATQENLARLVARGASVVGPASGELACGWLGSGRLVEPADIVEACVARLARFDQQQARGLDLAGRSLLVTAGPTHEAIDPVRFVGNRSSGKMGFAIARRAAARGAKVVLVAGPVALPTPAEVERVDVVSARELEAAVREREEQVDCVVKAAAVADFRPVAALDEKLKKGAEATLTLTLQKNPDILAGLVERRRARRSRTPFIVGFAAETEKLVEHAQEKLTKKGCDLLVANDVSEEGSRFGGDTNRVLFLEPGRAPEELPLLSKDEVADRLLDRIIERLP